MFFAYICALILWLFSYWSSYIDPSTFSFPALLSLNFLPLTVVCTLLALYWAFRIKWQVVLFIIALFLVRNGVTQTFAIKTSSADNPTNKTLKIMTQNVEVFNVYGWQKLKNGRDKILKIVKEEKPDVLVFQEFYSHNKSGVENNNIEHFKNLTNLKDYHFSVRINSGQIGDRQFGLVIFSKYPIVEKGEITLQKTRNQIIYCDIAVADNQKVRIFNAHLQSIYLTTDEFDFSYEINNLPPPSWFKKPLSIIKKLRTAYIKRGKQTNLLAAAIEKSPYPVILCGDFNDTPVSYTYNTIKKQLNDTFLEDSFGIGTTYAGSIPALRIDYIFADPFFKVLDFKKIEERNSDHFALITELAY